MLPLLQLPPPTAKYNVWLTKINSLMNLTSWTRIVETRSIQTAAL